MPQVAAMVLVVAFVTGCSTGADNNATPQTSGQSPTAGTSTLSSPTPNVVPGSPTQIATGNAITEYAVPTANSQPRGMTAGPDGDIWFTEYAASKIGKITTGGAITECGVATAVAGLRGIAMGPDGNLWFTEYEGNKVGKITTAGSVTEYL